jgi:hypothetical protein
MKGGFENLIDPVTAYFQAEALKKEAAK